MLTQAFAISIRASSATFSIPSSIRSYIIIITVTISLTFLPIMLPTSFPCIIIRTVNVTGGVFTELSMAVVIMACRIITDVAAAAVRRLYNFSDEKLSYFS